MPVQSENVSTSALLECSLSHILDFWGYFDTETPNVGETESVKEDWVGLLKEESSLFPNKKYKYS